MYLHKLYQNSLLKAKVRYAKKLCSCNYYGRGDCEKILNLAEENRIKLITSQDILKELKEVLQKKFKFDKKMSEMTISL